MSFFGNIKDQLENTLKELTTIEHALVIEEDKTKYVYRFQQTDGDSYCYISPDPLDEEYYPLFNAAFSAATKSRTSLSKFIIECIT
jgi:hypothetical protein